MTAAQRRSDVRGYLGNGGLESPHLNVYIGSWCDARYLYLVW